MNFATFKLIFLMTDLLLYALVLGTAGFVLYARKREYYRTAWRQIRSGRLAMVCMGVVLLYAAVALLDSVHFQRRSYTSTPQVSDTSRSIYQAEVLSLLDLLCDGLRSRTEKTFSAPFATHQFVKEYIERPDGKRIRDFPKLQYGGSHIFGTDQVGRDVLFRALKGCRVGLIVGTLTTLIATPIAILFGIMAGYFGGWIDDIIQYIYTTLSSIPSILLIAAAMLIVTTRLQTAHTVYGADTRLVWLCVVLGIGNWTGLCRVLRGETLKVRENDYIQASEAFGVSHLKIMFRHILPNVMHIVLITLILRFSGLVLAEAVLAYVGIGVDPSMESWGNMINGARMEISRDPIVWWNLVAAFVFMFGLVLPANIFGDAVRDAFDPRLRTE